MRIVGYQSRTQAEWTWPQTIALYIAVFCAVGMGIFGIPAAILLLLNGLHW